MLNGEINIAVKDAPSNDRPRLERAQSPNNRCIPYHLAWTEPAFGTCIEEELIATTQLVSLSSPFNGKRHLLASDHPLKGSRAVDYGYCRDHGHFGCLT